MKMVEKAAVIGEKIGYTTVMVIGWVVKTIWKYGTLAVQKIREGVQK
ncbi:MAG: hypothetical protein U9R50_04765 [Campylobacterota bacterium]|nr:hypothetical protein [Campylobacterota bacterium]